MGRNFDAKLSSIIMDAKDPKGLMQFYCDLLGWEMTYESETFCALAGPDGGTALGAQLVESYRAPVWPPVPGGADTGAHCDFEVSDLEASVAMAIKLGAKPAEEQFIDNLAVMIDPEGHPFCLYPPAPKTN